MPENLTIVPLTTSRPDIAMAMSGAAFDAARRQGVIQIEPNLQAMANIAHFMGMIEEADPSRLPALLLVARNTGPEHNFDWDLELPLDQGDTDTGIYYSANDIDIDKDRSPHGNRDVLVRAARRMGASALSELCIASWTDTTSHAHAFGLSITTGQRPLDLPPARSTARKAVDTALSVFDYRGAGLRRANTMTRRRPALAPPFIITRVNQATDA